MTDPTSPDLFADKAAQWDERPVPAQISAGVFSALERAGVLGSELVALDFGAGTGLVATRIAERVQRVLAVDISRSMLDQLAAKAHGAVEVRCQDILREPLPERVDLVVSAMALHHVEDTAALLWAFYEHLVPGGRIALADLDTEEGDFHPPGIQGVFHAGFDRAALAALATAAGFVDPRFDTALEVQREGKTYPVFLLTARKPA
jgi:SAM-dependent methyltransferase